MGHKSDVSVEYSKLIAICTRLGAKVDEKSYTVVNPGTGKQILVEKKLPKGATVAKTTWVELRGQGKTPYLGTTDGVVDHTHSSPSIKKRLDLTGEEAVVLKRFELLVADSLGIVLKVEEPASEQAAA
jgi:hypothetical protein